MTYIYDIVDNAFARARCGEILTNSHGFDELVTITKSCANVRKDNALNEGAKMKNDRTAVTPVHFV